MGLARRALLEKLPPRMDSASALSLLAEPRETARVSTLIIQAMLRAAARNGFEARPLFEQIPATTSPSCREELFFRMLGAHVDERAFGLRAVGALERGDFEGLEYAVRSSSTLREGLRTLARFSRLVSTERPYRFHEEPCGKTMLLLESERHPDVIFAEFALGFVLQLGRETTGVNWSPDAVHFRHAAKNERLLYERFFGAPVLLEQEKDALVLDPEVLELPLRGADPALHRVLERYLRTELETVEPARSLELEVRASILRALSDQDVSLDSVAAHLGLSPRVLQKRLQQAGTSFQELLDRVRESLAKRYLLQPTLSLAGTALALGYSDVTAFHRAFKRWTGLTPGDFRRRAGQVVEPPPPRNPRTGTLSGPDKS